MQEDFIIQNQTKINNNELGTNPNHETFIIFDKGELELFSNYKTIACKAPAIIYIPKNTAYLLKEKSDDISFHEIQFTANFFSDFYFEIHKYFIDSHYINFEGKPCFGNLISLCEMILFETKESSPKNEIIYNLWNSIFSIFKSEQFKESNIDLTIENNFHFHKFIELLEMHYKEANSIEFYADKLIVSTRQLNKIAQDLVDKNISTLITARKIIEAKNQIIHSNKSIAEIGYELGFKEKAYFTRVFKANVGLSPTEFKKKFNYKS